MNSLYKAELIYRQGPWRSVADVELATLAWVEPVEQPQDPFRHGRRASGGVRSRARGGGGAGAAMRRASSSRADTCATCYYAGDPARRPDCEHRAVVVYGAVAL